MKTLLLIGGTGFFGKSILDSFRRGGLDAWEVERMIAMSRNAECLRQEAPELLSPKVELISADIGIVDSLPDADLIIHAAASTDATKYVTRPLEERRNIQAATYNYCRLAPKFHAHSNILYVSSGAVYGVQPDNLLKIPESYAFGTIENVPKNKRDYTFAKREAECAIIDLGVQKGLSVSIARCFAFVGPWLPRKQHFAIGNFIEDGLFGRSITVKAQHQVYRSYMHADDLTEWLMTIASNAKPDCPIYNVGSDTTISVRDLAVLVAQEFGVKTNLPVITERIIDRYVPSICKAKNNLGLQIKIDLPSAIRFTVNKLIKQMH